MAVIKIEAKKDTRCTQTVCLIQGDRRTQILRFSVNRYDGGVDLSDLVWVIKTVNAKGVDDAFEPAAVEISDSRITIDWLVDGTVTDASGMAKYELNGLDATVEGKAVIWKGGTGTMSLRANIGENFGEIDMTNIDRLVLYVEGRLQDIIDLTEELQGAGDVANAAAIAANAGAQRAEAAATAANAGATAATEAASNANAAADAANTAALPHAQLYGMRVRGETARASGNPVTFLPDAGSLLQPVTVLEPKQAGSGDPYPAGGGKNLLPYPYHDGDNYTVYGVTFTVNNGAITVKGTAAGNLQYLLLSTDTWAAHGYKADVDYCLSIAEPLQDGVRIGFVGDVNYDIGPGNSKVNVRYAATDNVRLRILIAGGTNVDFTIYPQLELGTVATEYAPPSNIRPFIGYDAVNLNASGKNLLNNVRYYDNTHTDIRAQYDNPLLLKAGVTYTLSTNIKADGLFFVDAAGEGSLEAQYLLDYQHQVASLSYTPTADVRCMFVAIFNSGVPNGATIQLEVGSATAYEPYQGNNYTVQIGQTVYGIRYEWLTGKGVIEWAMHAVTVGDFAKNGANQFVMIHNLSAQAFAECACSHFIGSKRGAYDSVVNNSATVSGTGLWFYSDAFETAEEFNEFINAQNAAGTPVQIAYKLETPIEIQLTPHIISAVEPEQNNTLYGDGTIEVEYVKPLHVSIEERVAAALAAAAE